MSEFNQGSHEEVGSQVKKTIPHSKEDTFSQDDDTVSLKVKQRDPRQVETEFLDKQYRSKAGERLLNALGEEDQEDDDLRKAAAPDLKMFAMETKQRKILHNLVLPIYNQIEGERKVRANMEVQYDRMALRIDTLEGLLGAQNHRPKLLEDVEDKLQAIQGKNAHEVADLKLNVDQAQFQLASIQAVQSDYVTQLDTLRKALEIKDEQIARCVKENMA